MTKQNSETVANEETFKFTLELDDDGEILSATQISYHCRECGAEAIAEEGEVAYCEEHPDAIIDSVTSNVELVDTPTGIGDESDTDVVFFTDGDGSPKGSFGLQVRNEDGGLKAICDLDGEVYSFSGFSWIIPDKVPAPIAEHARAICS